MKITTIILISLVVLLEVFMANDNTFSNTNKSDTPHLDTSKEADRFHLHHWITTGVDPFVKKIGYIDTVANEPKDEHVDYDPNQLIDHFTKIGWKAEIIEVKTNEEYGDKDFSIDFFKDNLEFGLYLTLFQAGSDFAAKNFISDLTATSAMVPYQLISKEKGLGTLAVHDDVDQSSIYWFYRNTYTHIEPAQENNQQSALEMELALEVQKIFNEHTKKINK